MRRRSDWLRRMPVPRAHLMKAKVRAALRAAVTMMMRLLRLRRAKWRRRLVVRLRRRAGMVGLVRVWDRVCYICSKLGVCEPDLIFSFSGF